ncbi:hypothetical protein P7M41_26705, partial [Vibrio parahaemolyticus]|nr:hypothetical protein [Vibrio parahaemolyticus]
LNRAGVKAVLTGKRQRRKSQNHLGQCGQGIKATVALGQIFFFKGTGPYEEGTAMALVKFLPW